MKKTRASIFYSTSFGRNDGPPLFYKNALETYFKRFEVTRLIPEGDISRFGKFDLNFWVDWGEDGLPIDHSWKIPDGGKKIYIVSDHHLDEKGYRLNKAKEFDYVFLNQKWYLDDFKKAGVKNVFYLPHAAEPKAFPHYTIIKKYDLCFIGHIQEYQKGNGINIDRLTALDYMFKQFPNFIFGSRHPAYPGKNMFEDCAKKFCESKIVFNISIGNDLNMRFFETLMTGSFLLTNWIPELKSAEEYGFIDGVHYVSYNSLEEAVKKAKYYIEHDEEREKIAREGRKQALKTSTYKSRIEEILKIVEPLSL